MRLTSLLSVLAVVVHHAHSSYVALAPTEFHPGWDYTVQLMVSSATSDVVITGTIYNSQKTSLGAGSVTLSNGGSGQLDIKVPASVSPDSFTLELVGTGGLSFSNSTTITLDPLTHLTFIQTDKKIYKANQLIRVRVLTVDKDLVPQKVAKTITIQNPMQSTLAKFQDDGTKSVFEDTYQLTEFPDLGDWKIVVESKENNINEELTFKVDEYVLPKFEVSAEVVPSFLIKDKNQGPVEVTVAVTATYTYGKGVMGEIKLTVMGPNDVKQEIRDTIVDPSGKKNMAVDLTQALNQINSNSGIQIKVEVTDETQRTYDTMVTVRVEDQPVKVEFDKVRTDLVYRTGMPIQVVVKVTDPVGMPLDTMYMENPLTLSLTDREDSSKSMEQTFSLTAGQTEVVWNIPSMTSTNSYLDLRASMTVGGRELLQTENIRKYETVGNATLNARWTAYTPMLSMGSSASFVVDVSDSSHFSSLAYMIVSRGNIQAFGSVVAGQTTNVAVTTDMCPKGKLVVYGVTTVSPVSSSPEIIADSLDLKLEHCQDKKVTPSVGSDTQKTGTSALINVDVTWTDSSKQQSIGQHDVYMLAVDKSITLLEGDNDINPARVETELEKFNLESASGKGGRGPLWRRKRSIIGPDFPGYSDTPTSTGELLQAVGLVVLADVSMKQKELWPVFFDGPMFAMADEMGPVDDGVQNMVPTSAGGAGAGTPPATVTVRKDFPDTWIFKSIQTDNNGQAMTNETLPDTITSWVISAFAIRDDSEIAVTADPFELNAYNPFFVSLNLPYSIRRTERFELRATVFNYESSDLATTVILASSDKYEIAGDSSKTMMVKSNTANSVTFMIVATKVDLISIKVTARAQNANGARFVDAIDKKLIVKPEGVERMRAITFPVMLSDAEPVFDQNVALDFSPWTLADVVPDSRRARVKITGDMMGNALEDIDRLVSMPTGCGEQNMITTIPNIYAMAYLTAIDDVKPDFALKALEYMKTGYTKETQQYRWDNGGYSAFGKSDQAASTWLTAFVLKSFAQAKQYIPNTVDTDILDSAVSFLFTRQTQDSGLFYELGRVIHDDMQGGTGVGDALSVYIVICMLEAKKYGVEIDDNKMSLAFSYVLDLAERDMVKDKKFLSAITAYALALYNPTDAGTVLKIESLISYIVEKGAPWRQKKESDTVKPTEPYGYHHPSGPSDVEIGAYCLLALHTVGKVDEGREILLWLQKQQNSNGGFSSTQDTVMALQAIAAYSTVFANRVPSGNIVVTPLDPSASAMSVDITADNSAVLQIIELPDETNMLNIRVTGNADSIAVVKVVWYFYTAPNTEEQPPSGPPVINISNPLKVTTRTTMVRPGFHNVEACMKPDGLDYNNMMVLTMNMPSGFVSEDLQEARNQNPSVVRMEQEDDMVHCYFNQPEDGCVNLVIEETVKVENLKPGSARVYAYYKPDDFQAEASIQLEVPCVGENCGTSRAACPVALSRLLLAACVCLLLSLVVAL